MKGKDSCKEPLTKVITQSSPKLIVSRGTFGLLDDVKSCYRNDHIESHTTPGITEPWRQDELRKLRVLREV